MARRERKVGVGLSAHVKHPLFFNGSTGDEIREFFAQCNAAANRPWGWQADLIDATRRAYEETATAAPDIFDDLDAYNEFFRERVTQAWYEKELVRLARAVESAVAEGQPWRAVEDAMRMGELYSEVRLKFGTDWEKVALSGRASAKGSNDGAAARAAAFKHRHNAIRANFAERVTRTGDEQRAKNATAREFNISRRQLNRILAK